MAVIKDAVAFLEGRHSEVRKSLEARMKDMSERYEFESAAKVRDQIRALDDVTEKQKIIMTDMKDRDVLGVACSKEVAAVALLPVRKGKLMGREGFILSGISWENISGILGAFISQHYSEVSYVPN